jgi:hypothetical protein
MIFIKVSGSDLMQAVTVEVEVVLRLFKQVEGKYFKSRLYPLLQLIIHIILPRLIRR